MKNTKKKYKRVDSRRVLEGESAARRQRFYDSGVPLLAALLFVFVILAELILSLGIEKGPIDEIKTALLPEMGAYFIELLILAVLTGILGMYIAGYQKKLLKNYLRAGTLLACLLVMMGLIRLGLWRGWSAYLLVVPLMIMGIIVTVSFSQRFALVVIGYLALASVIGWHEQTLSFQQGMGILLSAVCGAGMTILMLGRVRTRSRLIKVSTLSGLVVFLMVLITSLWEKVPPQGMLTRAIWGGAGAVAVGFIMQGLLPLIEQMFHTATDMTLMDYGESTKPLLKRLAVEAPGTFNHSWQIGMLSESAAETIGANGLLCRVGSYYHDVGKLNKPRYFVENQSETVSRHKELSPTMSRMIIIGHVKDGLELLREYKIPKILHQFTETHHGTSLVEYFYHEATKKEAEGGQSVAETEFRYPGPKPMSKEAAIVMLADTVEGATRAMKEPTPNRIEQVVHTMALKRLLDGQFDECDLTMRELHLIEDSLVKSLCGMYHGRIAYPKQDLPGKKLMTGNDLPGITPAAPAENDAQA